MLVTGKWCHTQRRRKYWTMITYHPLHFYFLRLLPGIISESVIYSEVLKSCNFSGWTRVLYSTKVKLFPWIPNFIVTFITTKALVEVIMIKWNDFLIIRCYQDWHSIQWYIYLFHIIYLSFHSSIFCYVFSQPLGWKKNPKLRQQKIRRKASSPTFFLLVLIFYSLTTFKSVFAPSIFVFLISNLYIICILLVFYNCCNCNRLFYSDVR